MKATNINLRTQKENHESRLVAAAGLPTTFLASIGPRSLNNERMKTNSNKRSKGFGLSLALCLFAAVPALAQPTVVGSSFSVDTWASVVNMTVSFGGPVYVDPVTATDPANYVLQDVGVGGATLSNGTVDSTGTNVTFDVTGVFGGDNYTLNVSGVQDQSGSTMVATNLSGTLPAIRFMILNQVGTASSSSNPFGLPPGNARDDDITTIAHTFNNDNEWWELDLGTNSGPIGAIAIWFRTDCCYDRDRHLLFSILDDNRATLWTGYIDQALPATNPRTTNMVVGAAVMGRFVRIEHPTGAASQDFLDFTEVQLLGPSTGFVIGADPVSQIVPLGKPTTFTVGVQGTRSHHVPVAARRHEHTGRNERHAVDCQHEAGRRGQLPGGGDGRHRPSAHQRFGNAHHICRYGPANRDRSFVGCLILSRIR